MIISTRFGLLSSILAGAWRCMTVLSYLPGITLLAVGVIGSSALLTDPRRGADVWPLDVAFVMLGVALLIFARRGPGGPPWTRFRVDHPRLLPLGFGSLLALLLLSFVEITTAPVFDGPSLTFRTIDSIEGEPEALVIGDPVFGYRPRTKTSVFATRLEGARVIYDVRYNIESSGRRMTRARASSEAGPDVLVFGCSFVFGDGVEDDETLPSRLAELAPASRVFNLGYSGYGPHQMLARLQHAEPGMEPVQAGKAVGIYVFIDNHVERAVGSMLVFNLGGRHTPCYEINRDNELVTSGSFTAARPFRSLVYRILWLSKIVQNFTAREIFEPDVEEMELTSRIIAASRSDFMEVYDGAAFIVVLYPGSRLASSLIPHLEALGVDYLDCSTLFDPTDPELHIAGDGHPSPKAYELLAERLVADLGLNRSANAADGSRQE